MKRYQQPSFEELAPAELAAKTEELKTNGFSFVNVHANRVDGACELIYAFRAEDGGYDGLTGFVVTVGPDEHVPSISSLFPAAFVFENEAHDLFGVKIEGISIDFEGSFYTTTVQYPMNPQATAAETMGDAR